MRKQQQRAFALGTIVGLVLLAVVVGTPRVAQATEVEIGTSQFDATIDEQNPTSNYGGASSIAFRSNPAGDHRFLIQFDLSGLVIPPPNRIVKATIYLDVLAVEQDFFGYPRTIEAHRATGAWVESTVTWANQPTAEAASTISTLDGSAFDVTSSVVGWKAGTFPNYGVLVRATYEGGDAEGDGFGWSYCSRESIPPLCVKPRLVIRHELKPPFPNEVVEIWYYYSDHHGAAHGPAYVYAQFEKLDGTYGRYRLDIESADVPSASGPTWAIEAVVPLDWRIATAGPNPIVNTPDTVLTSVEASRYPGTTSWFVENTNPSNRLYAGITYHLWFFVP